MAPTRRRVLLAGASAGAAAVAGCNVGGGGSSATLVQLGIAFDNRSDDAQVFSLAVEWDDGLGEWHTREVADGEEASFTIDTPEGNDGDVVVHAVVNDRPTRGDLFSSEEGEFCASVQVRYDGNGAPELLQSVDTEC